MRGVRSFAGFSLGFPRLSTGGEGAYYMHHPEIRAVEGSGKKNIAKATANTLGEVCGGSGDIVDVRHGRRRHFDLTEVFHRSSHHIRHSCFSCCTRVPPARSSTGSVLRRAVPPLPLHVVTVLRLDPLSLPRQVLPCPASRHTRMRSDHGMHARFQDDRTSRGVHCFACPLKCSFSFMQTCC